MLPEETIDLDFTFKKQCIACFALIDDDCKFCSSCGARQSTAEIVRVSNQWQLLQQAAIFYGIHIAICCASKFIDDLDTFTWLIFFEIFLAVIAISFFAINHATNIAVLRCPAFSVRKLAAYCAIAMAFAFLVHYAVTWLNIAIFSKEERYYTIFKGNQYAEFLLIFFTAVMPALFEELAFRGYLLGVLLKVADSEQAIYISSFLFAIIHLSFLSLFWLIPFALFIGYMRVKEKTIWYGIAFHFCFNLTACLFELF